VMKGAFVVFEAVKPVPTNVIAFQCNPEAITRSMSPAAGDPMDAGAGEALRGGDADTAPEAPIQVFELEIELDASDGLERNDPPTREIGLHARIAQLELLMYPPSAVVILNEIAASAGSAFATPPETPKVLFFWGPGRVLPVRVTSVAIEEQAFDERLNPLTATARVGLRTLTQSELCAWGPPFTAIGVSGHVAKELLARAAAVRTTVGVARSDVASKVDPAHAARAAIRGALPF